MAYLTTTIEGIEYGAEKDSNGSGWGLFHRGRDGSWVQDRGTGQTPSWTTEAAFRRWVLRERRALALATGELPRGRPVSTGSSATKPIVFRVTAEQRAELDAEARRLGLPSADLAAKRRAFPG